MHNKLPIHACMNKYTNSPWRGDVQYLPLVEIITINLKLAYSRRTVSMSVLSKHRDVQGRGCLCIGGSPPTVPNSCWSPKYFNPINSTWKKSSALYWGVEMCSLLPDWSLKWKPSAQKHFTTCWIKSIILVSF